MGNSLKVSVCASSNAYFHSGVDAVNDANADAGDTTVTVDDGTKFVVRDIVKFAGHDTKYRITGISSNVLTITSIGTPTAGGLTAAVADDASVDRYWEFYELFDKAPGTSASASLVGASNDEIHLVVVDEDGVITGTENTVLETFGFVSLASDGKDAQGQSNYYVNVLERDSKYVYWSGHDVQIVTPATDDRTLEE